jgi:hypothetical protein
VPFRLTRGLATFQRYINSTLSDYLNQFCSVYIDDILIFRKDKESHIKEVNLILKRLKDAKLQVDIRKSEFIVTKTKFLGLIVLTEGLKIDSKKVKVIDK